MPITITIINEEILEDVKHVEIEITDGINTYAWGVGGIPLAEDTQAYLDARAARIWAAAAAQAIAPDVYERIAQKRLLKAFALVMLDEINILRAAALLPARTAAQIETGIKGKLRG